MISYPLGLQMSLKEIQKRHNSMSYDKNDLFNKAYDVYNLGKRRGTWKGHGMQIKQAQRTLRKLLDKARELGCDIPGNPGFYLNLEPPSSPMPK